MQQFGSAEERALNEVVLMEIDYQNLLLHSRSSLESLASAFPILDFTPVNLVPGS